MIKEFVSVNLYTVLPEEIVAFYRDKLGIPCLFEGYGGLDGAQVGFPDSHAHLTVWDSTKWGDQGELAFVFRCDSLDATYAELKSKGVEADPPYTASWGGRELLVRDPLGNKIWLLE
jgi:catechol 2,3-dioxygenase-like lactoylglutathione lyase family enzyme